jgi:Rap/ran-GAP
MLVTYMQAEVDFDSDAIRAGRKVLTQAELNTLPSYMMTQVHTTDQPPLLLTEDEATLRSIRTLDYMPVVNFHTIGITYVGWGQTTEEEILSNETGSGDYQKFLEGIGTTVRLKGNTEIYHGGLDINEDLDGTHAYFWSDRTTQITFIVYTMIPLNKEGDRRLALSNKKRNAANCFVNIIWNESNEPYSLDTIASEFNSNSIVISRHSRSSSETDTIISSEISPTKEQFFKVKLVQTDGMPEVSPIMDEKIVSASSLAPFVRSVALKLSIFCQIYIGRRERSHWVARLDQIRQIADRALQKQNVISPPPAPRGALSPSISNATLSSMGRRVVSTETRTEGATSQRNEDDPLNQWMTKYDFSRYT